MAAGMVSVVGLLLLLLLLLPSTSYADMWHIPLSGNVYPIGHFYATMYIGEPAKPYFLDIDTGSSLTWIECDAGSGSCERCNKVPHPLYRPTPDKLVPCASPLCNALHQDLGTTNDCRDRPNQCDYDIAYLDGSGSRGVLLLDKLSPAANADRPSIAFGCGYDQVGPSRQQNVNVVVDGILGLGRGSIDLVSQLKQQRVITNNLFGHCFSSKGGGYLVIGMDRLPLSIPWVPMSRNTNYYSPGPATLNLDTELILTKPMEVIFDSGSTFTHLPEDLHAQLVAAVLKATLSQSLEEVHDDSLPEHPCWKQPGGFKSLDDLKKEFKSVMSLEFQNGATMMIPPERYLVVTVNTWNSHSTSLKEQKIG
nr:unnamed protein product [Digitaria exilis]